MSRDELYEEKGLDCLDHDAPPKRVSMRKPDTRNTQKSESGRKTFQPSRSEEHTSELQSLMRISYAVFCLKKKKKNEKNNVHDKTKHHTNTVHHPQRDK